MRLFTARIQLPGCSPDQCLKLLTHFLILCIETEREFDETRVVGVNGKYMVEMITSCNVASRCFCDKNLRWTTPVPSAVSFLH